MGSARHLVRFSVNGTHMWSYTLSTDTWCMHTYGTHMHTWVYVHTLCNHMVHTLCTHQCTWTYRTHMWYTYMAHTWVHSHTHACAAPHMHMLPPMYPTHMPPCTHDPTWCTHRCKSTWSLPTPPSPAQQWELTLEPCPGHGLPSPLTRLGWV